MSKLAGTAKQSSNKQIHDETRYCENCGISFVWTREEQRRQLDTQALMADAENAVAVAPRYCPGCTALLPAAPRERGLVKWYHRRKGYGFISRLRAPDLYVHRSAVQGEGLAVDDLVEFAVGQNELGAAATAVLLLNRQG